MEIGKQLAAKRKELNLSGKDVALLLNLDKNSIAKWENGVKPSSIDKIARLTSFINGNYDRFVIHGRLIDDYDHEEANALIFPRNPTNDFYPGNQLSKNAMAEQEVPLLHPYWDKEIDRLESKVGSLLEKIESLQEVIKAKNETIESLRGQIPTAKANKKIAG